MIAFEKIPDSKVFSASCSFPANSTLNPTHLCRQFLQSSHCESCHRVCNPISDFFVWGRFV